ncbi:RHS repeat-associated core domain-containing protein [Cruoricaptor ignavus]|nr:RHS repeat-associated core domain-containing protein [Cruoricaptor ignavus]
MVAGILPAQNFHDTQGNIEVNGGGQLQYTLPIALPPGVKSVAPQINLVYTSGAGNGIAGYGWNLSGITSITRMSRTIEKDGAVKGIQLDDTDYFSFNGQRLLLKSGTYGSSGAEYVTEKFSNVKIRSIGNVSGHGWTGPEYWEVTFEDGSQAWYGNTWESRTPVEYNISKWKDAQGNYISYNYFQSNNVAAINSISWGGNENLGKSHFNQINFYYSTRELTETSYVNGVKFLQDKVLNSIQVKTNGNQFKRYQITHTSSDGYPKISLITEYNSQDEAANPAVFNYQGNPSNSPLTSIETSVSNANTRKYGDFDYDGVTDFIEMNNRGALSFKKSVYVESEAVNISYNTSEFTLANFRDAAIISYKNNNVVGENAGIVIPIRKNRADGSNAYDYEFRIYAVNLQSRTLDFKYSKTLLYENYKAYGEGESVDPSNCYSNPSSLLRVASYDYDGDGISEVLLDFTYELTCYSEGPIDPYSANKKASKITVANAEPKTDLEQDTILIPQSNLRKDNTQVPSVDKDQASDTTLQKIMPPDVGFEYQSYTENSTVFFDLKHEVPYEQSFFKFNYSSSSDQVFESADFNGDGIDELYKDRGNSLQDFYNIKRDANGHYSLVSVMPYTSLSGLGSKKILGDFNGDGKVDMAVPQADKSSNWKFYMSTGKGFDVHDYYNFIYFSANQEITNQGRHNTFFESGCNYATITNYQYQATDLDQDGKSEIVVNKLVIKNHAWNAHNDWENTSVTLSVYSTSKPGSISSIGSTTLPFNFGNTLNHSQYYNQKVIPFQPLFINKTNRQIILIGAPDDCPLSNCSRLHVIYLDYKHIPTSSRISSITQGKLTTDVQYAELLPGYQYKADSPMQYPYMALNRVNKSYVVSSLVQESRRQDFRYKGLVSHLHGRGMVGFRQTARSSWYSYNYPFYQTIIWSGAEMDPLQEGVPVKEWSIKTADENLIFPSDISVNNSQLLSFKSTQYRNDALPYGVKALLPVTTTTKDFQRDITTTSTIISYNEYYLPTQTVSSINNGFATTTTNLEYLHNPGGTGKDYYIGRPKSKTETVQVYGDSKGAKEDYEYENNLLKSKTSWNQNNSGWIRETYSYDGFGNTTSKTISNSADGNTQSESAQYEATGRFVVKKTDNLGLQTSICYNDWGQVLEQTDPLGNKLTNTYDGWGKMLTSKTNLGGTTTYTYEKFYNGDARITEYSPDGDEKATYTNKIGQIYKTRVKSVNSGRYVAKDTQYDELGRKTAESEPYYEGEGASKWNTIQYDEYSRPIKATSFTGKVVESSYNGRTVTVTETNANNRFKKQTADALGNIISSEDKGGVINFKFNAAGQVTEAKYGSNIVTTKYDEWGRKSEFYDPSNGLYKYQYNAFGQVVKETSPKGNKEYSYNSLGQLISQREITTDGTQNTDKTITYAYNDKGLIISKNGSSKGKAFGSSINYDNYGRILSRTESGNGRSFWQSGITYDDKSRVTSYEKGLYSNGVTTKVTIENVYDSWSGELFQLKDKNTGKVLWELQEANAKGQVTRAKLGATDILNIYDQNGFLMNISHTTPNKTILQVNYSFNAIKNELNSRNTGGDLNISESFNYDDNNRLVSWTNPRTGGMSSNGYDAEGRIKENDMLGSVKFENNQFVYRPTSVVLNAAGQQKLANDLVQNILYNENNDPVFIDGVKGDVRFEYGLTEMRQMATYGGNFAADGEGKFTKYYSEDGSYEIIRNNQTGQEKHLIYIGGSPYESNIVYLKNFQEAQAKFVFLHKDYLGSILAISDEAGNKIEQRHFDAWGNLTHLQVNGGAIMTDENQIRDFLSNGGLLLDRGYTSHEHFAEVGLIHMNGRLYDPLLRRFLNADENIQDMFNTQNYNKYGYVMNNPLMLSDPSGEFFVFLGLGVLFWKAVIIGAAIGLASYTVGLAVTGNIKQWNIGGALKSMFWGAVSGAVTFGIGSIFSVVKDGVQVATSFAKALGEVGTAFVQAGAHAVAQGALSLMQGGSFTQAFWSGALGSLGASAFGAAVGKEFANKALGQIAFGAVSGGIGAELTGGNFWQGAVIGGIVAGLNHAMHKMNSPFDNDEGEDPPGKGKKTTANKIKYGAKVGKEIGASAEFIDAMDKSLKGNSKILGKFGKVGGYLSAGGQIIYDGVEYINGEISGYRFSFRLGATVTSYVAGMEVGAAIGGTAGGPAGFVVGTTIGVGAGVTESAWDTWWPQFKHSYNNFINTAISNWMRYR